MVNVKYYVNIISYCTSPINLFLKKPILQSITSRQKI